jgi:Na+-driven multidrug efflux pump
MASLKLNRLKFYSKELKEILIIGIPAGLQQALYSIANLAITKEINKLGEYATTGLSIANNYDGILYQISTAPGLAVMPYVSQNIGNRNVKRAREAVIKATLITFALGASFGALSAIFSGPLSSIMADNPEIIKYSQQKMVIVSSTYFICGINDVFGSSLRAMGKSMVATVTTLIFMCAIRFPWVYLVYPFFTGNLTVLYLIWPIGWILSIITLLFFYFPTVRKIAKKEQMEINRKALS